MKVYVAPADAYGCGHYRLVWPAQVLFQQGFDVRVIPPGKDSGFQVRAERQPDGSDKLVDVMVPPDADVVVLQRPAHPSQPQLVSLLRERGVAVVVDMDDDMSSIHPENVAFRNYSPRSSSLYSWTHAADSCRRATMVTATTPSLLRTYAPTGRGMLLDNYVPEATLGHVKPETGLFGWAGTTASHPNDLQVTGRAIQQVIDDGFGFRVVGGRSKVQAAARLVNEPQFTGHVALVDWVRTIAESYDVGLVPLAPTAFNTAKSTLKGKEHMAAGVPFVYSPREGYRKLNRESGCGLPAERPKDWFAQVKRLLTDKELWKEQAELGKCYMKDQTYQNQSWRWWSAWDEALKIERGGTRLR